MWNSDITYIATDEEGYEMKSSMRRKGDCWDNAPTESMWGRLKVGGLYGRRFATRREAMDEVMRWLNFYNYKKNALDAGLRRPDDVRATLDGGPAARQEVRRMRSLWSAEDRDKITQKEWKELKLSAIAPMPASCWGQRSTGADK